MTFLDLEKAFDRVDRSQLLQMLNMRGVPFHLIEVIERLYKVPVYKLIQEKKVFKNIYKGVRQGCNLSPAVFSIYIDDVLRNWKNKVDACVVLKRNLYLNTLLSADDQVIIKDTEDKLQKSLYILN